MTTARKPRAVPKPTKALAASALRVANGGGTARDRAAVRRAVPGVELVTGARVTLIRWFWHLNQSVWHE
jgi:hypothetical protein